MKEYNYTGDKIKNHFTAYLREFIRGKRWSYLKKMQKIYEMEKPLKDNIQMDYAITVQDLLQIRQKEELLFQEKQGVYLAWNELSDQRLIHALLLLNEEERRLIYQHVFEENSFKEMEYLNGLPETRVKSIYYYSIRKIRKRMGVNKNDL